MLPAVPKREVIVQQMRLHQGTGPEEEIQEDLQPLDHSSSHPGSKSSTPEQHSSVVQETGLKPPGRGEPICWGLSCPAEGREGGCAALQPPDQPAGRLSLRSPRLTRTPYVCTDVCTCDQPRGSTQMENTTPASTNSTLTSSCSPF